MDLYDVEDERIYARGYVFADFNISVKKSWKSIKIRAAQRTYYFLYDRRNQTANVSDDKHWLILCGTFMDVMEYTMDLSIIAIKMLQELRKGLVHFYDYIDNLCGRYLVIWGGINDDLSYAVQDATGMRTVFYSQTNDLLSSHIGIIQDYEKNKEHPLYADYCKNISNIENTAFNLPGNMTPYEGIKALIPNHVLDIKSKLQKRFWPRHEIFAQNADAVCDEALDCFRKQAVCLSKYDKKICMSLTGGIDSQISYLCAKPISKEILYFTYYDPEEKLYGANTHADTEFAERFAKDNGLEHKTLVLESLPKEETLLLAKANTWHRHITRLLDCYADLFSDHYIHVRSNLLEIVRRRTYYKVEQINLDPRSYYNYRYPQLESSLAMNSIEMFFKEMQFDQLFDYDFADVFYWEERCAMWHGASVLLESDIVFDTFIFFNYRKFLERMLAVDKADLNTNKILDIAQTKFGGGE